MKSYVVLKGQLLLSKMDLFTIKESLVHYLDQIVSVLSTVLMNYEFIQAEKEIEKLQLDNMVAFNAPNQGEPFQNEYPQEETEIQSLSENDLKQLIDERQRLINELENVKKECDSLEKIEPENKSDKNQQDFKKMENDTLERIFLKMANFMLKICERDCESNVDVLKIEVLGLEAQYKEKMNKILKDEITEKVKTEKKLSFADMGVQCSPELYDQTLDLRCKTITEIKNDIETLKNEFEARKTSLVNKRNNMYEFRKNLTQQSPTQPEKINSQVQNEDLQERKLFLDNLKQKRDDLE